MAASINNPAWLQWMQTLMGPTSRQTYAATLPPDQYRCLLGELPLHLIPGPARQAMACEVELHDAVDPRPVLVLNPERVFLHGGEAPPQFQARKDLLTGFVRQGTIAWVPDPARGHLLPFWLTPRISSELKEIQAGAAVSSTIDPNTCELLERAGILTRAKLSRDDLRRKQWQGTIAKASPGFRERGYAPLPSLIHPFHVAALRRYYRCLLRTGKISLGDGQSSRRYVAYQEPVARFFHYLLTPTLSALAGEPLQPSYVYMASYLSGAELKKHTDREQCEFSITFCLDFSPEPTLESPWPIQLDTSIGPITVYQALGDGLAYRGTRLPHYRGVLPEGQTSTSIFFHYVRADFAGSLD